MYAKFFKILERIKAKEPLWVRQQNSHYELCNRFYCSIIIKLLQ